MLRWTLALIVLANLLFFAWSQHWLAPLGLAPVSEGEPYRLQEQLHPKAIVLRPVRPEAASRLAPASTAADAVPGADDAGAATAPAAESATEHAPALAQ